MAVVPSWMEDILLVWRLLMKQDDVFYGGNRLDEIKEAAKERAMLFTILLSSEY